MNIKDVLGRIELYTNCDELTLKRIEYLLKEFKPEKEDEIKIREKPEKIEKTQPKKSVKYIPTKSILEFSLQYSKINNIDFSIFKVRNRSRAILAMKAEFCVAAYKEGYGYNSIGTFLRMHHISIIKLVKDLPSFQEEKK